MAGRRKCLAQPANMHVHCAFLDEDVVAPDFVQQFRAAENAIGVGHEEVQHPELERPQVDFVPAHGHAMRGRVEAQPGHAHHVIGQLRRAAAHDRFHPRQEFPGRKWLGHVVVSSTFQCSDLVLLARASADQDDRNILGAVIAAQLPREGGAGNLGQDPVQEHQVRAFLVHQRFRLGNIAGPQDPVSSMLQIDRDQLLDSGFIFHH